MSTILQTVSAEIRASAQLTSSFVASTVYTFTRKPEAFSIACTYTRASGIAGWAEMQVEWSPDNTTWYIATQADWATISAPTATVPLYLGRYKCPAPSSDTAISFTIPFTADGGHPHLRVSFKEASGLTAGTMSATLYVTQFVA